MFLSRSKAQKQPSQWYFLTNGRDDNCFYLLSWQRPALGLSPSHTREELDWTELSLSLVDTAAQVKVSMWAVFSLLVAGPVGIWLVMDAWDFSDDN